MSDKTILVIDDSATIRKLVDTHLGPVGYRVILAPNAEEGLEVAADVQPDLILLDHQLPGTTGYDVASQLSESPDLRHIPVVISSTLRKKAYAEYIDLDNVVDMLPKPYTEDLLRTTVANALETAAMIVSSQSQGTAIPEVIDQLDEAALAGSCACFGLRELIDFLNNGQKSGVLEVEAERARIRIHLAKGRIQGIYAGGLEPDEVESMVAKLPESLVSLAPVLKMTIGGRSCAEVDGFVQLLDQKVLDPRLMLKLLRFQATMLVRIAFSRKLSAFRFEAGIEGNALHKNLPLEISLLALLVEGALHDEPAADPESENQTFVRRAIRGQNLDRAGLMARHMKVLNVIADPKDVTQIAATLGWEIEEVRQVLKGFVMAELVEQRTQAVAGQFLVFEPNSSEAQIMRCSLEDSDKRYSGKVVRDKLALQLVLKRSVPHTLVFAADDDSACQSIAKLFATQHPAAASVKRIAMIGAEDPNSVDWNQRVGFVPDEILLRPCTAELLYRAMDRVLGNENATESESASQADLPTAAVSPDHHSQAELDTLCGATTGVQS